MSKPDDGFSGLECSLWFNSSKDAMREQLRRSNRNSGVGIHVGRHGSAVDSSLDTVHLQFDDGTGGTARVRKDSWGSCTHFIEESIGAWARRNGLWERKLRERSVPVWLRRLDRTSFRVESRAE